MQYYAVAVFLRLWYDGLKEVCFHAQKVAKEDEKRIVILGAGKYGIQIRTQFFSNENDVVFYDNNRRK